MNNCPTPRLTQHFDPDLILSAGLVWLLPDSNDELKKLTAEGTNHLTLPLTLY